MTCPPQCENPPDSEDEASNFRRIGVKALRAVIGQSHDKLVKHPRMRGMTCACDEAGAYEGRAEVSCGESDLR